MEYKVYTYTAADMAGPSLGDPPIIEAGGMLPRIKAAGQAEAERRARQFIEQHPANHQVAAYEVALVHGIDGMLTAPRTSGSIIDRPHTEFCNWAACHSAPMGCKWEGD